MFHTLWIVITLTYKNRGDLVELLELLWENRDVIASGGVVILTGTAAGAHFIRLRKVGDGLLRTRERVIVYRQRVRTEKEERRKREAITVNPVTTRHRLIGKSRKGHSARRRKGIIMESQRALEGLGKLAFLASTVLVGVLIGSFVWIVLWTINEAFFVGGATIVLALTLALSYSWLRLWAKIAAGLVLGLVLWTIDQFVFVGFSTIVLTILLGVSIWGMRPAWKWLVGLALGIALWLMDQFVFLDFSVFGLSIMTVILIASLIPIPEFKEKQRPTPPPADPTARRENNNTDPLGFRLGEDAQ